MMPRRFTSRVVGVTFTDGYPESLHMLSDAAAEGVWIPGEEPLPVVLRRNPDNPHDPNAVEVHAPLVGQIGHLPRHVAELVAPYLDGGGRLSAGLEHVWIDPDHPDRPGVSIVVERVESEVSA